MAAFGWFMCGLGVFIPFRVGADLLNGAPVPFWPSILIGIAWVASGPFWKKAWEALQ